MHRDSRPGHIVPKVSMTLETYEVMAKEPTPDFSNHGISSSWCIEVHKLVYLAPG